MKNVLLKVLILMAVLSVFGYFIYRDYSAVKNVQPVTQSPDLSTTTPKQSEIKIIPAKGGTTNNVVLRGPFPDLKKKWSIPDSFSADAKRIIENRVAGLDSDLQKNPDQYGKWIELGTLRKLAGDYEEARKIWEFTSKDWPDGLVAHHNLGDLYGSYLKDYGSAEKSMLKVISLDPTYISEYVALSGLYKQMGGVEDARAADILVQGLNKNPGIIDIMMALAGHYKEAGDKTNAQNYYEMALARAKDLGNLALEGAISGELKNL